MFLNGAEGKQMIHITDPNVWVKCFAIAAAFVVG